jgi:hypothetical protein
LFTSAETDHLVPVASRIALVEGLICARRRHAMNGHKMSADLWLFKIDANRSALRVGDWVRPETVIGEDQESGHGVVAGVHGQVEAISFSGSDQALVLLVRENGSDPEPLDWPDLILFKIDASRCSLRVGDPVAPESLIGEDIDTANVLRSGVHGKVDSISYSSIDHALLVLVRPVEG